MIRGTAASLMKLRWPMQEDDGQTPAAVGCLSAPVFLLQWSFLLHTHTPNAPHSCGRHNPSLSANVFNSHQRQLSPHLCLLQLSFYWFSSCVD